MAKVIRCDRCKKLIEGAMITQLSSEIIVSGHTRPYDLCTSCASAVCSFIQWPKEGIEWLSDELAQEGMRNHLIHSVGDKLDKARKGE